MSLKCMIDKWLHKGQISQEEYDAVMKKLEGHDKQVRVDAIDEYKQGKADQKKEDNEFFNFDKVIEIEKNKSYNQGAREFAEWLNRLNYFNGWYKFDGNEEVKLTTDEILAEWQKED